MSRRGFVDTMLDLELAEVLESDLAKSQLKYDRMLIELRAMDGEISRLRKEIIAMNILMGDEDDAVLPEVQQLLSRTWRRP